MEKETHAGAEAARLTAARPDERQIAWQELGFTAFLHYGMNTFTDREWGTGKEGAELYAPRKLDTDQWCAALSEAGIKACILTAKHHDGFCLWDTAQTRHSVIASPRPADVAALLAKSCSRYGLKLGFYLSPWDRHEPSYGSGKPYDDFFCAQLEELTTRYGELYALWFDGANGEGPDGRAQIYDWERYYALIRRRQPGAAISICGPDVRWVGNEAGATRQSEWSVVPARLRDARLTARKSQQADDPAFRERPISEMDEDLGSRAALAGESELCWYPAEVDVSIRPGFFWHPAEDSKVKPLSELLGVYERAVGGNAALLLNVPPDTDGLVRAADADRLREMGAALRRRYGANLFGAPGVTASSRLGSAGAAQAARSADPAQPADLEHPARAALSGDESWWQPPEGAEAASLTVTLPQPVRISRVVLREQVRESQRIEAFSIYARAGGGDEAKIYSGSTVGFKKICALRPIEADAVRIAVEQSRGFPTLRSVEAY
jgi:alpha-L-fucosidase